MSGLVVAGGLVLWSAQRQLALDRELIAALMERNPEQALELVNEGANPNTSFTPPPSPSLRQLWNQLLHHISVPVNASPTAWLFVCGTPIKTNEDGGEMVYSLTTGPDNEVTTSLKKAMVAHHADVNAEDWYGRTPLMFATTVSEFETVRLLLAHGARVNVQDRDGETALWHAVENYYIDKRIFQQLLAHGADPNIPDCFGRSPLEMAELWKLYPVVAILKRAGDGK